MTIVYVILALVVGFLLGWVLKPKQTEKVVEQEALRRSSGQAGFISESIEEKQKNLGKAKAYLKGKTRITNDDLQKELGVSDSTIVRYLNDLEAEGLIKQVGDTGKYTYYDVKI